MDRLRRRARLSAFSEMADGCAKSSKRLEEGLNGIADNIRYGVAKPSPWKAAAAVVLFCMFAWRVASACNDFTENTRERVSRVFKNANPEEEACVRVSETFIKAVGFPSIKKYITYPKIVSRSGDMVLAAETLDLAECQGKIIKRSRHLAVSASHGDLRYWPLTLSRTTTFVGEHAVCLQHAVDVLEGAITCDST